MSSLVTTPAGRSPRTATSALAPAAEQRERLVERGRRLDQRQRRVHHLADGPLDDDRVAEGPVEQALLADRPDEPDDVVALGLLRHRQLADAVRLERGDGVADPLGRAGDDDGGHAPDSWWRSASSASTRVAAPVVGSRPLARIHSSL